MGGHYEVKVASLPPGISDHDIQTQIQATLDKIEHAGSTYLANSELNQINRTPVNQAVKVSALAFELIQFGVEMGRESDGAYELTIGPLVDAWGFGPQVQPEHWLTDEEINQLKTRIGYQLVGLNADKYEITRKADIQLNVNGIMQGFAADKVAALLESHDIQNYLINILGEVKARGHKQNNQIWTIAIETPNYDNDHPHKVEKLISLDNLGMATSGDYRNYYELDGKRISHIIDPFSGKPIQHKLASVSVIDKTAARADGMTKPLMVLGEINGVNFAKEKGISALFIVRDGAEFKEIMTGDFETHIEQ